MAVMVNVSGTFKSVQKPFVKINTNDWKPLYNIFTNVGGIWKAVYSYSWYVGAWGGCSVNCGGGVQTRDVHCVRNDGRTVEDIYCLMS